MRFSVVGPSAPLRGGIAQHTDRIVEALGAEHEVDLYPLIRQYPRWLFPGRSQLDPGARARTETRIALDPYQPGTWKRVACDIAGRRPDLVLVQWWHPWFAPMTRGLLSALRRELGEAARITVISHNALPHGAVPFQRTLARHGLGRARRFVVHAEAERVRLQGLVGRGATIHRMPLINLAPEGAAPDRRVARQALGWTDERIVLFFGLVREYKGVRDLIEALPLMAEARIRVVIAGEFYEPIARYEQLAERLGVTDRVVFRDEFVPEEEVAALFAAADVVALPYRSATQSSVLPLAIHYRKRFVVTDVGGLVEASQGLAEAVPARSPGQLAAALDRALAAGPELDESELDRWEVAEQAFTLDGIRRAFEGVARAAAGSPSGAPADGATVVVSAHGECPDLEDTVRALVEQVGVPQPEVLVVYDGDEAPLRARLAQFAARGVRVVPEPAFGLNVKRNRGLQEASHDRVLFTDDDCVPDPEWVQGMCAALNSHSVVTGRVLPLGVGVAASVREGSEARTFRGPLAVLLPWRAGCGNNLGVRKAHARAIGGFDARIGVGTWSGAACDTEFLFRSLRARGGEVYYAPDAVVRHRQEPLGPAVLRKRRNYYRGMSFMARTIHPHSAAAWSTALLRVCGTAAARAWSGVRLDRSGWQIHGAEFHGAVEGFFPPKPPGPEGASS
ncbi:GDP-mannose-dependent alpha-(1-6)-phosphatidylinositol monomannoside mannosyltransferase [Planctomycetes bacterium Poly30]|uniref:GDP-mannose-dependent alpha-(1-6)-phosphatidylinositol monomannoside mannosyltransferase n=1 Tax=Saltatorellus ferox TaxID=2528018 RepID=A0A518EP12_9BACT|nr:GDP-mannose-dependent alpha-(1-6)-phosphatidylinositol monomannoside mannosyltransferase [Planctomycetes bacterium Poly30]